MADLDPRSLIAVGTLAVFLFVAIIVQRIAGMVKSDIYAVMGPYCGEAAFGFSSSITGTGNAIVCGLTIIVILAIPTGVTVLLLWLRGR